MIPSPADLAWAYRTLAQDHGWSHKVKHSTWERLTEEMRAADASAQGEASIAVAFLRVSVAEADRDPRFNDPRYFLR